jgi:LCP family protein required for cell wall assembly
MAQYTRHTSEQHDPPDGPQAPRAAPNHRRWPKVLRLVGLILVAIVFMGAGAGWGWLQKTAGALQANAPLVVRDVQSVLTRSKEGQPVNILLIGSDRRTDARDAGDKGRSDTMLLVRMDPQARTISMLSVPRDLWVDIPGNGMQRVNVAYTLGGPKLTVQMFKQLTGLPITHFIDINFLGFANIVDKLGGIYVDVDRRYYNKNIGTAATAYSNIDLQPGYQLLKGRQALSFCRFRHDATGDFNRMVRQQIFLHEVERQAKRWNSITGLPGLIQAFTKNSISDITFGSPLDNGTNTLFGLAKTALGLNTSQVYQAHITGIPVVIGKADVLQPDPTEIRQAVSDFTDPKQAPLRHRADKIAIHNFPVRVLNGSGKAGLAEQVATALRAEGYQAQAAGNADTFGYVGSVVYAPKDLQGYADAISSTMHRAVIHQVQRLPGTLSGVTVIVGSSYTQQSQQQSSSGSTAAVQQQIVSNTRQDLSRWQTLAASAQGVAVMMPTVWSSGMYYSDQPGGAADPSTFRAYTIASGHGNRAAVVVVGETANQGFWHIEETTWTDPPMLSDPNDVRTINGRAHMLFYQGQNLHRVAFKANGCLYWVTNTLDDQLSNQLMLALATSMVPVR